MIGASGVVILPALVATFPHGTLLLIIAGGVAYCSGVVFHLWKSLNFHNVIWHSFVVLGATIHLWAVLNLTVLQ
jgi:hemolysin III